MALLVSGVLVLAQFVVFLMIGVGLYVFYNEYPPFPAFDRPDRVFPHFIVTQLPAGLTGLLIAAMLAAAMSTLSSSLNSSAGTSLADFYRPLFNPHATEHQYLKVSRLLTAFWGGVQVLVAIAGAGFNESIVNQVLGIASFTNGPILGMFILGAVKRRVTERAALTGLATGIAAMLFVHFAAPRLFGLSIAWTWYVLLGSIITSTVGCVVSLLFD
jgi:Na+/proline symporter